MRPSECCIFRMICASILGSAAVMAKLWVHHPATAVILAPLGGSVAAVIAASLFYAVGRIAPEARQDV